MLLLLLMLLMLLLVAPPGGGGRADDRGGGGGGGGGLAGPAALGQVVGDGDCGGVLQRRLGLGLEPQPVTIVAVGGVSHLGMGEEERR